MLDGISLRAIFGASLDAFGISGIERNVMNLVARVERLAGQEKGPAGGPELNAGASGGRSDRPPFRA